mmetsp:Transcript_49534/g.92769  ORF Transcript_49534/g.92769 Transcript_49534/m.92769 type:complete len:279 (-) Transcript_49534:260-1096(-)
MSPALRIRSTSSLNSATRSSALASCSRSSGTRFATAACSLNSRFCSAAARLNSKTSALSAAFSCCSALRSLPMTADAVPSRLLTRACVDLDLSIGLGVAVLGSKEVPPIKATAVEEPARLISSASGMACGGYAVRLPPNESPANRSGGPNRLLTSEFIATDEAVWLRSSASLAAGKKAPAPRPFTKLPFARLAVDASMPMLLALLGLRESRPEEKRALAVEPSKFTSSACFSLSSSTVPVSEAASDAPGELRLWKRGLLGEFPCDGVDTRPRSVRLAS